MRRVWGTVFVVLLTLSPYQLAAQSAPPIPSADEVPIVLLVDVTSDQVLYKREADRRFVPASVTKVMTLFHAFELIDEGYLDPSQQFQMQKETWEEWFRKG
ncbi:MAG: serine hydrolase, partial [Pseudomonadota bacterium]